MAIILVIMVYPLYFTIIASFSEPMHVAMGNITVLPKGFTLEAYQNAYHESSIWTGYRNTIIYTVFGTIWSYASAIGLFETIINVALLLLVNSIAKKVSSISIW